MNRLSIITNAISETLSFNQEDIKLDTTLDALGADSLDHLNIVMQIEDALGIELTEPEEDQFVAGSVNDAFLLLAEWLGPEEPIAGVLELTDDQFIRRYDPEMTEQGDYYRQREWYENADVPVIKQAIEENRCWTMIDDDNGDPCITWGNRVVNRLYNIITRKPIENPDWFVYVSDGGDCPDEEALEAAEVEQLKDEKRGLYPDKEDIAN